MWITVIVILIPQGSASECVLVSLLAARYKAIKELKKRHPHAEDGHLLSKMVAYTSKMVSQMSLLSE